MQKLTLLAVVMGLGLTGALARADEGTFQKLELKNSEAVEMETQAVEGGKQQIQMSDPETRDAILRVKQELEKNRVQEAASGSDSDSE